MIKIAICDDEQICRDELKTLILEYNSEFNLDTFQSAEELLKSDNIRNIDILFVDIEMPQINGLELSKKIVEINNNIIIFYVTSYISLVTKALNNFAFTFIPKPINKEDLFAELDRALVKYKKLHHILKFATEGEEVYININDIVYIESMNKDCLIHMRNKETIKVNYRLKNMVKDLKGYDFVQAHQSFCVNMNFVKTVSKNKVILVDCKEDITISRKHKEAFWKTLNNYMNGATV